MSREDEVLTDRTAGSGDGGLGFAFRVRRLVVTFWRASIWTTCGTILGGLVSSVTTTSRRLSPTVTEPFAASPSARATAGWVSTRPRTAAGLAAAAVNPAFVTVNS